MGGDYRNDENEREKLKLLNRQGNEWTSGAKEVVYKNRERKENNQEEEERHRKEKPKPNKEQTKRTRKTLEKKTRKNLIKPGGVCRPCP